MDDARVSQTKRLPPRRKGAPKKTTAPKRSRSRYSAEDARDAILLATEKRLMDVGPQGLRLQEIARDVGLSHPTVIHHFGSRDGLVEAVARRAVITLERDLLACFKDLDVAADPLDVTLGTLERVDEVLRRRGHARLLAWLVLSGHSGPRESLLRDLALAIQAAQKARGGEPSLEDAIFRVLLSAATMFGVAILGTEVLALVGLPQEERIHARFRRWFASMLVRDVDVPAP